jgi:hypothetical protein
MVADATSTVLRGSLRSAFNGSGEIVQRGRHPAAEVLEPAGHPSGGSHTASASELVSAANTRSGAALMTRTAVSVLIAGAPVALVDHARAERPGLDQV